MLKRSYIQEIYLKKTKMKGNAVHTYTAGEIS